MENFTTNLNQLARVGGIDPLIGREKELERAIQVLCRRRKNNQSFLNRYAKDYQGGYWEYLQASNGAFFMEAPQPLWLSLPNYFEGECSAREVGIIVCLYAYSYFCGLAYEEGKAELNETMANRYHLLREYVNTLENESQNRIYRAID